ncbi:MAG: alkaline phosphatase family protein [Bifidobacteriaceae bacterium]|jgi:predicted AlkP superfamily pyrophosphatase or phosphodiesterase|nr:alkaline phosphatase family protein [Bifidobacteriaceae bacterium]
MKLYDYDSLSAVVLSALGALGVDYSTKTELNSIKAKKNFDLPKAKKVLVILVDGLGYNNLSKRIAHAPYLKKQEIRKLNTSFPSTTAAALATFSTGTCPGQTGILGYSQLNPLKMKLANMLTWENAERPESLQRITSLFDIAAENNLSTSMLGYKRFRNSGVTKAIFKSPKFFGQDKPKRRVDDTILALQSDDFVYLYWGEIDKTGHKYGWRSAEWSLALEFFDAELNRLIQNAPKDTLILLTADHGMIDADMEKRFEVTQIKELQDGVKITGGEARAMHLYLDMSSNLAEQSDLQAIVKSKWQKVLAEYADVYTKDEAIEEGFFGKVNDRIRSRIGDVIVQMKDYATVTDSRTQTRSSMQLVGYHGSITPAELEIPLVVVKC